jgi:hypothetical protein
MTIGAFGRYAHGRITGNFPAGTPDGKAAPAAFLFLAGIPLFKPKIHQHFIQSS